MRSTSIDPSQNGPWVCRPLWIYRGGEGTIIIVNNDGAMNPRALWHAVRSTHRQLAPCDELLRHAIGHTPDRMSGKGRLEPFVLNRLGYSQFARRGMYL
jgi:hypothetical protein